MLHVMTITHFTCNKFNGYRLAKTTSRYLLTWEGVKRTLENERRYAESRNRNPRGGCIYYITLAIYRGQPID